MPISVERARQLRRLGLAVLALGAVWHATRFDFFCDDAYIALRYAKNLLERGELSYNAGERVEGFTSPLWVVLVALGGLSKASLVSVARALGAVACVGSLAALAELWDELEPDTASLWVLAPAALLASSVPFAAWSLAGLETPLFVALYCYTLALLARTLRLADARRFFQLGLCGALATLCRPEGAVLLALSALSVLFAARGAERPFRKLGAWAAPVLLLVGGYELFRLRYYGYPLPNTFYVKTTGDLWLQGLAYLRLAASELGWPWLLAAGLCALLGFALPTSLAAQWRARPSGVLARAALLVAVLAQLAIVASVGGDFLDLYRFLTPCLPLLFCLLCGGFLRVAHRYGRPAQLPLQVTAAVLLAAWGATQQELVREALGAQSEPSAARREQHLEPLWWTRLYGLRWAGIGRVLARVRKPGDTLAIGAAGAIPFYSELPTLDLFGLNDAEIAHHGRVISSRPGHQRFAATEYLYNKRPTFLLMYPERTPLEPQRLELGSFWGASGYAAVEMRVDAALCECGASFYHQFYVRKERLASLSREHDIRVVPSVGSDP